MQLRAIVKVSVVLCDPFPIYLVICFFLFGHTQVALSQHGWNFYFCYLFWLGTVVSLANFHVKKNYSPKIDENRY